MKTTVVDIHKVKGKRPEFDVYIGRATNRTEFIKDSKWKNPYNISYFGIKRSLELYKQHLKDSGLIRDIIELKNKRLGCWCITTDKIEPLVCHGQVLMKLLQETEVK